MNYTSSPPRLLVKSSAWQLHLLPAPSPPEVISPVVRVADGCLSLPRPTIPACPCPPRFHAAGSGIDLSARGCLPFFDVDLLVASSQSVTARGSTTAPSALSSTLFQCRSSLAHRCQPDKPPTLQLLSRLLRRAAMTSMPMRSGPADVNLSKGRASRPRRPRRVRAEPMKLTRLRAYPHAHK